VAEIKWWAWLSVGLVVTVVSAMMGGPLWLFMWVGIFFIIVGAITITYKVILSPDESPREKQLVRQQMMQQPVQMTCPNCRRSLHPVDVFCRYCGVRLR